MAVSIENANALAIDAITFLITDEERLDRFLSVTGATPENLRAQIDQADFRASVFDYLLQDELLLIAFASEAKVTPDFITEARVAIAGEPSFEI